MVEQRYRVIERLEAGGMAEVFIGEAQSVQGFVKRVAIKRVLPHLAQNRSFISMFLDEARLGARLNHANIVSVFDIGAADNTFFIVMEFVDGVNLKNLVETLRRHQRSFPAKEAIYICMEAARGLSYAHELADEQGVALNIVHRDVSPPNLLISKRGEVKVTDFGLAKAATQLEKTDPGVVKGKFSYLSPEATLGQTVDARADVFGLGVVLWEMLAGQRLFIGETDYETVKLVQAAKIPEIPHLEAEVGAGFERILGRALARDPKDRYGSAREFGDALAEFLFSRQLKVTPYDIANLVKKAMSDRSKPTTSTPQQQSIIDRLIQEELLRFRSIDELSDPLAPGITGEVSGVEQAEGAQPLDAGAFEDPGEWFGDAEPGGGSVSLTPGEEPRWFESGLDDGPPHQGSDLASLLESEESATAGKPGLPAKAARSESGGSWKYMLLFLVLLAGAGAAAWFGGVIPLPF